MVPLVVMVIGSRFGKPALLYICEADVLKYGKVVSGTDTHHLDLLKSYRL